MNNDEERVPSQQEEDLLPPEAILLDPKCLVWHTERRIGGPTTYYLALVDGEEKLTFTVTYDPKQKQISSDVYIPQDYDYTIHDGCDHEYGDCIEDTPEFQEQEWLDLLRSVALQKLEAQQKQLRERAIANHLLDKERQAHNNEETQKEDSETP